jgi:hypothetical protein
MDMKQPPKTPSMAQAFVDFLRNAAGMSPQQTPGRYSDLGAERTSGNVASTGLKVRAAEAGMTPEEYMRAQQAQQQMPR